MSYPVAYLEAAHQHSSGHKAELEVSQVCGCFYCLQNYAPKEIENWIEEPGGTALCPQCSIDSVIGDASGYPVNKPDFLDAMHEYWFQRTVTIPDVEPKANTNSATSLLRRLFSKTN
ncbi:hypothetical protein [Brevundimonas sp. NIBR11]|uniref:hypothetical protein n=1 Tax=Brevundimonas sp. NIBR11 TaxID=3015999 RepID=UPI0022F106E8|nr:hypothetical protein [Brevundimonas sp. NIBR11]WGM30956.1 hypothetical protein KKHFBJBL_01190 [Brevundimonas sp. NIBR11]